MEAIEWIEIKLKNSINGIWYGSIDKFNNDITNVKQKLKTISKYDGITYDENSLYDLITLVMNTNRMLDKLESYVSLLCDEDTRINKNQELKEIVNNLYSEYVKATYFVDNSILKLDYNEIEKFYEKNSFRNR